jgi:hypothetical protein
VEASATADLPLRNPSAALPRRRTTTPRCRRWLSLLLLASGCFRPQLVPCHVLCDGEHVCPSGYSCNSEGICEGPGDHCHAEDAAENDSAPASDALPYDLAPRDGPQSAPALCFRGQCPPLSAELAAHVSLWVDPSSLPALGQPFVRWRDRSDEANHLVPLAATPTVRGFKDIFVAQFSSSSILAAPRVASLDLGAGDLVALVVGIVAVEIGEEQVCLMSKGASDRGAPKVDLAGQLVGELPSPRPQVRVAALGQRYSVASPSETGILDGRPHLVVMRRVGGVVELRIDGAVQGTRALPEEATSLDAPLLLGACNASGSYFTGSVMAAAVLRGTMTAEELSDVEKFFARLYLDTF